jgi:plasmid stabilization system protein ParE
MVTDDERREHRPAFRRIDDAFRRGDLEALRQAFDDPAAVPNGRLDASFGTCLVYAIYHSPLAFIRTLLEIGADPNAPSDDGFPPLIAALSMTRSTLGSAARSDVDDILRLLLGHGADPNQRGLNDYTPLHMAAAEGNLLAVHRLLDAGADPDLATRIDECQTPEQMARAAGLTDVEAVLGRRGRPLRQRLRSGLHLLADIPGTGEPVRRQHRYRLRLRMWLHRGEPVRWREAKGPVGVARLEDNGATLVTELRIDRNALVNGLFYGVDGMRVGGTRRVEIAPHLAYGEQGVPGLVPAHAVLTAEITVLAAL